MTEQESKYQGYPSYRHWNVCLFFNHHRSVYKLIQTCDSAVQLEQDLKMVGITHTPEGVELTPDLIEYAFIDAKNIDCPTCNATGWSSETCDTCTGTGRVLESEESVIKTTCMSCLGTGKKKCASCNGTGVAV